MVVKARQVALLVAAFLVSGLLARPAAPAPPLAAECPETASVTVMVSGDGLSVHAVASPWPALLEEVRQRTGVTLHVEPAPEGTVTVSIEPLPMDRVLRRLFGPDASFVYVYRPAAEAGNPAVLEEVRIVSRRSSGPPAARAPGTRQAEAEARRATESSAAGESAPEEAPVATLGHADPDLRRRALDEIVERGDGTGVEAVRAVLASDADLEVRTRAVTALARIATGEALEALGQGLADGEITVRLSAIAAIASFETPRARALLAGALRDGDEQVRDVAAQALRALRGAGR